MVTFSMVHLVPGDPARALAGQRATPRILASIRHQLGVDQPLLTRYRRFASGIPRGHLGYSFLLHQTTDALVAARLPTTLFLVIYGVLIAIVIGVPLALVSAVRKESLLDHGIRGTLVVGLGLPSFWVGLLLIGFLALRLRWFLVGGAGSGFFSALWHLLLPAFTLALSFLAVLVRNLRASLIEVLQADHRWPQPELPAWRIGRGRVGVLGRRDRQRPGQRGAVARLPASPRTSTGLRNPGTADHADRGHHSSLAEPAGRTGMSVLPILRGRERLSTLIGCGLLGLVVIAAVFAPTISRYSPTALNPVAALEQPSPAHLFGTDQPRCRSSSRKSAPNARPPCCSSRTITRSSHSYASVSWSCTRARCSNSGRPRPCSPGPGIRTPQHSSPRCPRSNTE